jgi:hypothetical protein
LSLEPKGVAPQRPKESRDKYGVDQGHGVVKALQTVLLRVDCENKAQGMPLVQNLAGPLANHQDLSLRARRIKDRLQSKLLKGEHDGPTLRRLRFLIQVLIDAIERFEKAYPECTRAEHMHGNEESDTSDDELAEDEPPPVVANNPAPLRKSSSMIELARGLRLEEGDVHKFNSFIKERNLVDMETELSGEQLLEAILKLDKKTVEKEMWDKKDLQKVLKETVTSRDFTEEGKDTGGLLMHRARRGSKEKDWDTYSI